MRENLENNGTTYRKEWKPRNFRDNNSFHCLVTRKEDSLVEIIGTTDLFIKTEILSSCFDVLVQVFISKWLANNDNVFPNIETTMEQILQVTTCIQLCIRCESCVCVLMRRQRVIER